MNEVPLEGYCYKFKVWNTRRIDGEPLVIIGWPNHPSRHPFGDREPFPVWRRSVEQAAWLLSPLVA